MPSKSTLLASAHRIRKIGVPMLYSSAHQTLTPYTRRLHRPLSSFPPKRRSTSICKNHKSKPRTSSAKCRHLASEVHTLRFQRAYTLPPNHKHRVGCTQTPYLPNLHMHPAKPTDCTAAHHFSPSLRRLAQTIILTPIKDKTRENPSDTLT